MPCEFCRQCVNLIKISTLLQMEGEGSNVIGWGPLFPVIMGSLRAPQGLPRKVTVVSGLGILHLVPFLRTHLLSCLLYLGSPSPSESRRTHFPIQNRACQWPLSFLTAAVLISNNDTGGCQASEVAAALQTRMAVVREECGVHKYLAFPFHVCGVCMRACTCICVYACGVQESSPIAPPPSSLRQGLAVKSSAH